VIFDMDGVLVDSEPMHAATTRDMLQPLGITYSDEDNARYFGFTDREMLQDLVARHAIDVPIDELMHRRSTLVVRATYENPRAMPGVPGALQAIASRGYRLALASSSGPEIIAATLDALGVANLFEQVVSGLTVGHGKPAPDIFLATAERLRLTPEACLVVEDSRNGLLAAKAAGMACAAIPCNATGGENFAEADYRFSKLPELLDVLPPVRA
jgi:HAD superfamily hydrolase (TIGR01509 family)